ncbi:hypothetical protein KLA_05717 [Cellulophaga geojensis KL-A]|uniref:Secretion system C-terminal sorting domain-containing protein n=1 Tax=Cellulophaga geojensis KL-A TaxID=1328323 RepID=A0ABP3B9E1_9FLAO|nr:CARDB domain-containing protein [Cellulophaga geojensis]EWH14143.1 hypothetical protein KLA_05717 [Cellulophaga geojensis KL-A]
MKKNYIFILLFFYSVFSQSQDFIQNIVYSKSPTSVQNVGSPYEFNLTFDLIGTRSPLGDRIRQFMYFITEVGDNSYFTDWPVTGVKYAGDYTSISGGYRYSFDEIQLKNKFPSYPAGNYKVLIMAYKGGNNWVFYGGYPAHINDYTFNFNFNDFCSDCGDGIYYGNDDDGDGLLEYYDDCPNEAGPISNNGCPIIQGNSDLEIDNVNSLAYSACSSCLPWFDLFLDSNKRHLIAGGVGKLTFNKLKIKNVGNAISNTSKLKFYLSKNNTLDEDDLTLKSITLPVISVSGSYDISENIKGWDMFDNPDSSSNNGNYYIIIVLDTENTNNEGAIGEMNNILALPISYNSSATASSKLSNISDRNNRAYFIEVYNFSGQKILVKKVDNIEEENRVISSLKGGEIYIINSSNKSKKIYR